jgi:putative transposase
MPYIKIWIHAVWTTKNRKQYLKKDIRDIVFSHIKSYADDRGIHIDFVNGYVDHVHCLISLYADQSIAEIMQLIKGESSYWINKHELTDEKFAWQEEYYAASVSKSHVKRVRDYIRNQEIHHCSQTLDDEIEEVFGSVLKGGGVERGWPRAKARGN